MVKKKIMQHNPELDALKAENDKLQARHDVAMETLNNIATRKRNTREKLMAMSCIYFLNTNGG